MIGSDLEEDDQSGTKDLHELIEGYESLSDGQEVEVIVAFGGADKDGWRGMKFANISQIRDDAWDQEFGNETGSDAYLHYDAAANMDDVESLTRFLEYLGEEYLDFNQRFLTFWDHGNSYQGFGGDTYFNDGYAMSMYEMDLAFQRGQPGRFDLIGFDACFMASVEVAKVIEPYADYMIASEASEPGHGWLWSAVIRHYAWEDSVVEAGRKMVDNFVQDVHGDTDWGKTLSLLDLRQYDQLVAALNPVLSAFGQGLRSSGEYSYSLNYGSTRAQDYGGVDRKGKRTSIDLKHFTQLLAESSPPNADIIPSLNELLVAIDRFVVHSDHDWSKPNSFGIAIDAPENHDEYFSVDKISDDWRDFQRAYADLRQSDTTPPEVEEQFSDSEGTVALLVDDNLARVTTIYGFTDGEFFLTVAELEAAPTGVEGWYSTPAWDQRWFTVEYDPAAEETAWIPASLDSRFEYDGQEYTIYTAEIDYYQAGKDYSADEDPYDLAVMTLIVDEYMEVQYHDIQTYMYVYSGPEDEEGAPRFDKATFQIIPGDAIQFWTSGYHLYDPSEDTWLPASEIVIFVQEPVFDFEPLEFEDESGQPIEYEYAMWAEDVNGNWVLSEPVPVE